MQKFIGTKIIHAEPSVKDGQEGYKVVYPDGYVSWSPKAVFERAYRLTDGMSLGLALEAAQMGLRVARKGWNGKGMWVSYSPGAKSLPAANFWSPANREYAESVGGFVDVLPCFTMRTATGEILMGWLASQSDMVALDWEIVE